MAFCNKGCNDVSVIYSAGKLMKLMKTIMLGLHVSVLCFSSRNQLQELPSCIGRLSSLVSLHAEHNKLTQLCIEVVDCRKLEELVSSNQLLSAKSLRNW